jgi:xanthine dehydrogenase accessory factor
MFHQLTSWQLIERSLNQQIPVMLLYVLESKGSSPGRQGFMMVVNARGNMSGSLGGGIMEHKFVEMAKAKLNEQLATATLHPQYHSKEVHQQQSGMICSGEQTIFMYRVQPSEALAVQQIIASLQQFCNGTLTLTNTGISFSPIPATKNYQLRTSGNDFELHALTGHHQKLYIVGGGHCALALSRLMWSMDFYIHLYDDRPNLSTFVTNDYAHEKKIVINYQQLSNEIAAAPNHYVVIMTHGYRTDDIALRAVLDKELAYLGVLGSVKKIEQLFQQYQQEGISPALLTRIHAPIGICIKSQTPEEIAVSIAAQIIAVKNTEPVS